MIPRILKELILDYTTAIDPPSQCRCKILYARGSVTLPGSVCLLRADTMKLHSDF